MKLLYSKTALHLMYLFIGVTLDLGISHCFLKFFQTKQSADESIIINNY